MSAPPDPTWLFHLTAIDNLAGILASGALVPKSQLVNNHVAHASIAYEHIQDRRSRRVVSVAPGGVLHDYVPFHFAPRSPMLYTINQGNVPSCVYKQPDLAYLVTTAQTIAAAGLSFAFSDYHAVLDYARFSNDLANLDWIDWDLFFEEPKPGGYCRYWHNDSSPRRMRRKETRQAEFLVHGQVPLVVIREIAVHDDQKASQARTILQQHGSNLTVKPMPAWYY